MIFVGIDVAKDKHDCFITNTDGEVLFKSFTITNNLDGFDELYQKIESVMEDVSKVKVGLEATGHYSYNLLGYLLDKGLPTYVINPLHTNLYRKSLSLRQTKTDKVDAHTIASMLMSDVNLKSYSNTSYHNEELKSLTRYRFDKVKERAQLKQSISRLVCILFPELEKLVPTLHQNSVYELLYEFPGAKHVANAHLTRLSNLVETASKGHYTKDTAIAFREAARTSIGSNMPAKSLELKHTIKLIRELDWTIKVITSHSLYTYEFEDNELISKYQNENPDFKQFIEFVTDYNEEVIEVNKKNNILLSKTVQMKNDLATPSLKIKKQNLVFGKSRKKYSGNNINLKTAGTISTCSTSNNTKLSLSSLKQVMKNGGLYSCSNKTNKSVNFYSNN